MLIGNHVPTTPYLDIKYIVITAITFLSQWSIDVRDNSHTMLNEKMIIFDSHLNVTIFENIVMTEWFYATRYIQSTFNY